MKTFVAAVLAPLIALVLAACSSVDAPEDHSDGGGGGPPVACTHDANPDACETDDGCAPDAACLIRPSCQRGVCWGKCKADADCAGFTGKSCFLFESTGWGVCTALCDPGFLVGSGCNEGVCLPMKCGDGTACNLCFP